jgi:hypothetical protein
MKGHCCYICCYICRWGGFADSQSEDEWQHNVSTLRMQRTDHVALLMQVSHVRADVGVPLTG